MKEKIEDIFLVDSVLIIVSKSKIFKVLLHNCPKNISVTEFFDNNLHANTSKKIKDVIYSKTHKSFYLLLRNKNDLDSIICKFDAEKEKTENLIKVQIDKKIDRFEIDKKDPLNMFIICQKEVFICSLEQQNLKISKLTKRKSSIGINLAQTSRIRKKFQQNNRADRLMREVEDTWDQKIYRRVHANAKHEIRFFKFDKEMKYYYTHDGKVLKKYLYETNTLMQNFEGHKETLKNVMFTNDFSFMFR